MSVLSKAYMYDEAAAFVHVESVLWADGVSCPHCGNCENIYELKGVCSKPSRKPQRRGASWAEKVLCLPRAIYRAQ